MAVHLRTRIAHICQNATWAQEHIVLNHYSRIYRYIVLNLDVISDQHTTVHVHVLPDHTLFPNLRALHDMRKVPNLRAGTDVCPVIHISRFVRKVRSLRLLDVRFNLFRCFTAALQCALACIQYSHNSQSFSAVTDRCPSRFDTVEKMWARTPHGNSKWLRVTSVTPLFKYAPPLQDTWLGISLSSERMTLISCGAKLHRIFSSVRIFPMFNRLE